MLLLPELEDIHMGLRGEVVGFYSYANMDVAGFGEIF